MAYALFDELPETAEEYSDDPRVLVLRYAGDGAEQRVALQALERRTYVWPMRRTLAQANVIDAFFRARNWTVTPFLIEDGMDSLRTSVSLGTSVASQVLFPLPTTGLEGHDHPADDGDLVVYDDGTPVTVASVDTDGRSVTVSVAPTGGSVMTIDYNPYRLVRLRERFSWRRLAPDWFEAAPEFLEVPA